MRTYTCDNTCHLSILVSTRHYLWVPDSTFEHQQMLVSTYQYLWVLTPLCKGQAIEERHISEFHSDRSTVQILRITWRHFTCKVYGKNCLCRHHYWIQVKNMQFLWVFVLCCYLNDNQWGLGYTLAIWRHSRVTSHFHDRIKRFWACLEPSFSWLNK